MNYSYDPAKIGENGLGKMRFELGDCLVLEPEKTCYLSDEEILAVLESSKTWRRAKFRLVESLLRRFSYETDVKIQNAEWSLSDRVDEWRRLYNQLKGEVEAEELAEGGFGLSSRKSRPPIFRIGMHDRRK